MTDPADPQTSHPAASPEPSVERFLGDPTREISEWRWLWENDVAFPVETHRGGMMGKVLVGLKKLLRPLVRLGMADSLDRQRVFNLVVLEKLERLETLRRQQAERTEALDAFLREALGEALDHNDALYARADQKLDRYRAEARDLTASLGAALALMDGAGEAAAQAPSDTAAASASEASPGVSLSAAFSESEYLALERSHRGSEEDIAGRLQVYLPYLGRVPAGRSILDLGCGRGEALAVLDAAGIPARGVDSNARMVEHCRERGLKAKEGDLFAALEAAEAGSLGGVVSFHVIEHLPPDAIQRLVRLAWRALAPGGVLALETPNPMSMSVAARSFWLDPTHVRPVHPETLRFFYEQAGFDRVEHLELSPHPAHLRLPEIDLAELSPTQAELADRVNRLRDRLDEVLFGYQDFALVGIKAEGGTEDAAGAAGAMGPAAEPGAR